MLVEHHARPRGGDQPTLRPHPCRAGYPRTCTRRLGRTPCCSARRSARTATRSARSPRQPVDGAALGSGLGRPLGGFSEPWGGLGWLRAAPQGGSSAALQGPTAYSHSLPQSPGGDSRKIPQAGRHSSPQLATHAPLPPGAGTAGAGWGAARWRGAAVPPIAQREAASRAAASAEAADADDSCRGFRPQVTAHAEAQLQVEVLRGRFAAEEVERSQLRDQVGT